MDAARWQQIESLFERVLDIPASERSAFLDEACRGDSALRHEIESLLNCDLPDQKLITSPDLPKPIDNGRGSDMSGLTVGPYRLISLIGHGGMGSVYLGRRDDQQFEKRVAVKLLKRGMDTDFMLARFRQERQILANLEHPFIAHLLDGGATDTGLPYFVMEYVHGLPITQFCGKTNATIAERLKLFRLVCEAVQHAHQNLVVHRDIKPSNILATAEGIPKLLDFGIAKVVDPASSSDMTFTQREHRMLTPDYASPEQVKALPISTASDIYSLGAVLYELLSGQKAHQFTSGSLTELERVICEVEPVKPSLAAPKHLQRQLTGDLDNIVLTAMHKEPQRRYASAAELSEDIRRHLEGRPIEAHDEHWTYRAGKFIRRNRLAVSATLLVVLSLMGGIVAATIQARRSDRRFQLVRQISHDLLFDLHPQAERIPGSTALQAAMVHTVVRYLDRLAQETSENPQLELEIAEAYHQAAALEGNPNRSNLGQTELSLDHYQKALAIYQRIQLIPHTRSKAITGIITTHLDISSLLAALGKPALATEHMRLAADTAASVTSDPGLKLPPSLLTYMYHTLALDVEEHEGPQAALVYCRKGVDTAEQWIAGERNSASLNSLRKAYARMADAQAHTGDLTGAEQTFLKALNVADEVSRQAEGKGVGLHDVAGLHHTFGDLLGAPDDPNLGEPDRALEQYQIAVKIAEALAAPDPKDVNAKRILAASYRRVGWILVDRNPAESLSYYSKAFPIAEETRVADPSNIEYRSAVVHILLGSGLALHRLGNEAEALDRLSRAVEYQLSIEKVAPNRIWLLRNTSRAYMITGDVLLSRGNSVAALEAYRKGLAATERMLDRAPTSLHHKLDHADLLEALGRFYAVTAARPGTNHGTRTQLQAQARASFQSSLAIWQDWSRRQIAVSYANRRQRTVSSALAALSAR